MARKTGKQFTCVICSKEFYRYPSEIKKGCGITCGRTCWSIWKRQGETKQCQHCGKAFYCRRSQAKQGYGNYCSKPCWAATRKIRETYICKVCSSPFERTRWQIEKGFTNVCSAGCMTIWRRGKRPGTIDAMFTIWQKQAWLKGACERCGSGDDLQLDHIIPRFMGGEPTKDNAQTLCRSCNLKKYWEEDLPKSRASA